MYLFFDYDGTLRSRELDAVPASALRALDRLRENGHFVALATGRLQSDALEIAKPLGIDSLVGDGGNSVTIDGELVSLDGLDPAAARAFVHELDDMGLPWAVNAENARTCLTRDDRYARSLSHIYYEPQIVPDLSIDSIEPIYKVFVPCTPDAQERIDLSNVSWARYSDELLYIEPTDKARGIRKMMALLNAPLNEVIAFGDGTNDVDMFIPEWTSVAMGNAVDELKERANLITTSVNDDGIWNACVELGLI